MPETPNATAPRLALPDILWAGGHPTVAERYQTMLRRCLLCNARSLFDTVTCVRGRIVHLIEPEDVHAAPEAFDGSPWAEPEAMAGARKGWIAKGFVVVRKPDGPVGEQAHPRFRPCPTCNTEAMAAGALGPVTLPQPPRRTGR